MPCYVNVKMVWFPTGNHLIHVLYIIAELNSSTFTMNAPALNVWIKLNVLSALNQNQEKKSRMSHICVSKTYHHWFKWWLVACSVPAIIWTNTAVLSIRHQGVYFSEISYKFKSFDWRKCNWKCRLSNGGHFSRLLYVKAIKMERFYFWKHHIDWMKI